mgnify:CR=1 FL=1
MKKTLILLFALLAFCQTTPAHADLDGFLANLNIQARADLPGFKAGLSAQFGVPLPKVEAVFAQVSAPADVFMTLQLGQMSRKQPEAVLQTYKVSKNKGWGAMAKELGIKPGSSAFHALKRGDLHYTGQPGRGDASDGPGQGKGRGKGHNR